MHHEFLISLLNLLEPEPYTGSSRFKVQEQESPVQHIIPVRGRPLILVSPIIHCQRRVLPIGQLAGEHHLTRRSWTMRIDIGIAVVVWWHEHPSQVRGCGAAGRLLDAEDGQVSEEFIFVLCWDFVSDREVAVEYLD